MNADDVYHIFQNKADATQDYLASFGDDGVKRNAAINNAYLKLYKEDPTFIWLAAAVLGSEKVGQNLQAAAVGEFSVINGADFNLLRNQLSEGNQKIFEHMISRYLTYKEVGIEGLRQLNQSKYARLFGEAEIFSLFEEHQVNCNAYKNTATELGLSKYDPRVIEHFMLDHKNRENVENVAIGFMVIEQDAVQFMYIDNVVKMLTDPIFVGIGEKLGLTGVSIDGIFYSFSEYIRDPSDLNERIEYFRAIIEKVGALYQDHDKLNDFMRSVEVAALRSIFNTNPYKESLNNIGGFATLEKFSEHNSSFEDKVDAFIKANSNEPHLGFYKVARPEIIEEALTQSNIMLSNLDLNQLINLVDSSQLSIPQNEVEPLIPQDLYISLDLSDTNYQIVHATRADFQASPFFTAENMNGSIVHWGKSVPWMAPSAAIVETPNGKIFYYDMFGLTKGITFPMMVDASTNTLLTVPVDRNGNYQDGNTLDFIKNNISLFSDPGHIVNNNALKLEIIHNMPHAARMVHQQAAEHAISKRMNDIRELKLSDVIKYGNDSIQGLEESSLSNVRVSTSSLQDDGDWRCFGYDGIDTSEVINPYGGYGNHIVEMCIPKNPYYWEQ
ncbi:MAG: hypothetical protein U1E78_08155 [Gammaproteobacteria bacterium]